MSQYSSSRYGMTELLFPLKGHRNFILLVFFSLKAIAGHRRGESQMWFYEFLNSNAICMNEITLNVLKVTFLTNSGIAVRNILIKTLLLWSFQCLRTLVGHTGGVWSSQMRDNIIISGSTDRTLKVWNAETGECIHTLYGHTSTVRCMHLHEKRYGAISSIRLFKNLKHFCSVFYILIIQI